MVDNELVSSLARYAGLELDRPDEQADVRELLNFVTSHRNVLDRLDLDGIRPSHVFCFHHAARESGGP